MFPNVFSTKNMIFIFYLEFYQLVFEILAINFSRVVKTPFISQEERFEEKRFFQKFFYGEQ